MDPLKMRLLALLGRAVNVRGEEVRAVLLSFAYFFCLLCGYYILRPLREEMGIAGGVRNLPWLFTGTFAVMLAAVPAFGAAVKGHDDDVVGTHKLRHLLLSCGDIVEEIRKPRR